MRETWEWPREGGGSGAGHSETLPRGGLQGPLRTHLDGGLVAQADGHAEGRGAEEQAERGEHVECAAEDEEAVAGGRLGAGGAGQGVIHA